MEDRVGEKDKKDYVEDCLHRNMYVCIIYRSSRVDIPAERKAKCHLFLVSVKSVYDREHSA